ncbi:MAG: FAD-binding oxidoreductase [Cyanobacteria bacterium Co-bin13]|nr:FAD-binding oxidoreductase [Cyanobacteria bacterium Co-bin13]
MSDLTSTLTALGTDVTPWDAVAPEQKASIQAALGPQPPPQALVCPTTQTQLAEVMACAYQNRWRVLPCGSGSKLDWGGLAEGLDLVVSTRRLNRIIDHAVGDLTVTAEAGLTLADLQQALTAANQMLPLDPAYPQQATLGGLIATGDAGSLRQRYGGIRDMLIGLSLVRYDGQIAKAGGRVVKNVAGYDLMKLMTGSYGTLGLLSQVTFRTYPLQEASQTVVFSGSATAIGQLSQTLRLSALTPVALDVLSPALMAALGQQAFGLAARFQSISAGVEEQVQRLLALGQAQNLSGQVLTGEADAQFWQQSGAQVFAQDQSPVVIAKVGILPEAAISLLEQLQNETTGMGRIHASSGVGQIRLEGAAAGPQQVLKLRSHCETAAGYLTVLSAPLALKQTVEVWGYSGNALDLMRRLKQQFDPERLLSPGRFVGGI